MDERMKRNWCDVPVNYDTCWKHTSAEAFAYTNGEESIKGWPSRIDTESEFDMCIELWEIVDRRPKNEGKFQIGDRVMTLARGSGVVVSDDKLNDGDEYPIGVEFDIDDNDELFFTSCGRDIDCDLTPSLYHEGTTIDVCECIPKRLPKIAVDTPLYVSDSDISSGSRIRYFKEYDSLGRVVCFACGYTSLTCDSNNVYAWEQHRVHESVDK
jgi:hypothetical protein